MQKTEDSVRGAAKRITLSYALAGALWIYVSDLVLGDAPLMPGAQTLKGWGFVLGTSLILYLVLRRFVSRVEASQADLRLTQFATDNAGDIIFRVDRNARLVYANQAACKALGYTQEQLSELTVFDIDANFDPARWQAHWAAVIDNGVSRSQSTLRRRDGSTFPVEIVINIVEQDGEFFHCTYVRDIEQRLHMEEALRASEERFRQVILEAPIPVMLHATDGEILVLSKTWTQLSGHARGDLSSSHRWLELSSAGEHAEVFGSGVHLASIRTSAGAVRDWEMHSAVLGKLADGRGLTVTMALDLTERRALERQIHQTRKMEAIGRLAAGIVHDFNSLLTVIYGYAQLILDEPPESPRILPFAVEIAKAGQRASGLTGQLLAFTRQQIVNPVPLDVNAEVASLEKMLSRIIGENVKLLTDLAPAAGFVLMDPTQFGQMLLNLVVNARDAIPAGGTIRLASRLANLPDPREPTEVASLAPGEWCVLYVTDTGIGMADDVKARLFEPFFTTRAIGKGTGLGLATVHGIVEQAGGRITVESEIGEGSTFAVWLPRLQPSEVAPPRSEPAAVPTRSGACILVVEDDSAVRELVAEILRSNGFSVIEAAIAEEAFSLLGITRTQPDLVLSDVVMRGMSGFDFARKLRLSHPALKVIFMSGYTELAADADFRTESARLLRKPFLPAQLLEYVRRELAC